MYKAVVSGVPDNLTVDGPFPHYEVMVPVAERHDGEVRVALQVVLIPSEFDGTPIHEFQFRFAVDDDDAGITSHSYDRREMRSLLPPEVRPHIMPIVCAAARELCRAVQPDLIYRVTYERNPTDKMLCKHQMVTDTLVDEGIETLDSGTNDDGHGFWLMGKVGD